MRACKPQIGLTPTRMPLAIPSGTQLMARLSPAIPPRRTALPARISLTGAQSETTFRDAIARAEAARQPSRRRSRKHPNA